MELSKNARMKLFQRITGWSTDKMRANKKAVNDIVGCDGGSTPGSMSLDDFKNFSISVPNNMYWVNRSIGDIVQLDEILNVSSIDVFRALTSLNVDSDTEIFPSMLFTIMNSVEGGMYRHNITISPKNNLGFNIDITTNGDYVEGDMAIHEYCNMHLYFNGETLEIINITEGE